MLGEAAYTADDARRYARRLRRRDRRDRRLGRRPRRAAARAAVDLGQALGAASALRDRAGARACSPSSCRRCPRSRARRASAGIGFTVDAEEAERLELVARDLRAAAPRSGARRLERPRPRGAGLPEARARRCSTGSRARARAPATRIPVRLVKGAYWDTEIKRAQVQGLDGYPVFTRKAHTDVSYLACARALLDAGDAFYPMFATHNAHTIAWVARVRRGTRRRRRSSSSACTAWARRSTRRCARRRTATPAASTRRSAAHEDLLPYLVRRLLENGANTSFVHRIADPTVPLDDIVADPGVARREARLRAESAHAAAARALRRPRELGRRVDRRPGRDGGDRSPRSPAREAPRWRGGPIVGGERARRRRARGVAIRRIAARTIGTVVDADTATRRPRARVARRGAAGLGRARRRRARRDPRPRRRRVRSATATTSSSVSCARPARRGWPRSPKCARRSISAATTRPARAASSASRSRCPRPPARRTRSRCTAAACSPASRPWNFPLAIFTGQVAAALAAGNTVAAKPAEQTPLCAALAVEVMLRRGPARRRDRAAARPRRDGRRGARRRCARRRRRVHRLDRGRLGDRAHARRATCRSCR